MNEVYKLTIEDLSDKAEGIAHIDGKTFFVKGALPGETVEAEILEDKGRFFKAQAVGFNPFVCGGAPLLRMPYEKQLLWKQKHVKDCLERLSKLENPKVNPAVGMVHPFNYRNKGEFKVGGKLPYCNTDCRDCPIQSKEAMAVLSEFRENPRKNAKELIVRNTLDGQVLSYTIQNNDYVLLYSGQKILKDNIGHIKVEVDPFSFYQVNSVQREKLYDIVKSYVCEGDSLLDLYCGAGTIGLYCADKCSRVIGVENLHQAILSANRNAIENHIVNATFVEGNAEEVVSQKLQGVKADTIIVDPPRAGCKQALLETIKEISPKQIIYVSCDPATLARDIKILCEPGKNDSSYKFIEATPVDMFPHTVGIETVCLLSIFSKSK